MSESFILDLLENPDFVEGNMWTKQTFQAGKKIFNQGDIGDAVYVILSGKVRITSIVTLENSRRIEPGIFDLETNGFFGEVSVFDRFPRSASALAIEDSVLAVIKGEKLLHFMDEHKDIGYPIMKMFYAHVIGRLRASTDRFNSIFAWGLKARDIDKYL